MNNSNIVRQIIDANKFLTLATTDGNSPWASTLFFAVDDRLDLFYTSYNDSVHVKNITRNPEVALVIFDSHAIPGKTTQGVQIKGRCMRVAGEELEKAIETVYLKRFPDPVERLKHDLTAEFFSKPDNERVAHIYKITPEKFYILDKKAGKDTRAEVDMGI